MGWFSLPRPEVPSKSFHLAWMAGLLLLIPLRDSGSLNLQGEYNRVKQLFLCGNLETSQREAEQAYRRFQFGDPGWAARFRLLEAEAMSYRGMQEEALRLLAAQPAVSGNLETSVKKLVLESVSLTRLKQMPKAGERLAEAEALCARASVLACGEVPRAKGIWAMEKGDFQAAQYFFQQGLEFARAHHDSWMEAFALSNLGPALLEQGRYDEAADWSRSAYLLATELHGESLAQRSLGNLGFAYFGLGEAEKALGYFLAAEKRAEDLGDLRAKLNWLSTAAYVYQNTGDLTRASHSFSEALELAKQMDSKEDVTTILVCLAQIAVASGNADQAEIYANQALAKAQAQDSGNRADQFDAIAVQSQAAALRGDRVRAEQLLRQVESAPESQNSMKWASERMLARLYERQGDIASADASYRAALTTFEAARAAIQKDDYKLPFITNAQHIYDDYIHFLISQGKVTEALAVADDSRARTLAQGLGIADKQRTLRPEMLRTGLIARHAGATVLFYWLGERQSYLWAIAPDGTRQFTLPPQSEIAALVKRYQQRLLNTAQADDSADGEGAALYRMLVAPAAGTIRPGGNVTVVCDGPLSLLNFETLVVPSAKPHYWIEDANITSAPSLYMLATAKAARTAQPRLLLMGDAVSPNPDYPDLPMASAEMKEVQKHFEPAAETVFARRTATADAYLKTVAQPYSYIHFVAHGVASRTEPLDSAIILSRTGTAEDSFKLHARDIIQHPINAQLVTISACYGGGTRSYAGEGLVGLSWAFLRAGAHNVIGALWEASDDSTPPLMDSLYQGLEQGMAPSAALRQAKLNLMHSQARFSQPFYWAPFQIYTGM